MGNFLQTCRWRSSVCHRLRRRQDVTWRDMTGHDMTWDDMTEHDMILYDMTLMTGQGRTWHDITLFSPSIQFLQRFLKLSWQLHECALCTAKRSRDGGCLGLAATGADAREIIDVVVSWGKESVWVLQIKEQMVTDEESALPVTDEMSEVDRSLIPWRRFARIVLLHVHAARSGRTLTGSHVEMALETLGQRGVEESAGFGPGTVICDWRQPWSWRPFATALKE